MKLVQMQMVSKAHGANPTETMPKRYHCKNSNIVRLTVPCKVPRSKVTKRAVGGFSLRGVLDNSIACKNAAQAHKLRPRPDDAI